jgi:ParB family chromosome partitioning protein
MIAPTIDLDALEAFEKLEPTAPAGKPIMIDTGLIHEDPEQPRKVFDDTKQRELCASVAESGIRIPISVRPHPSLPGQYMLNFGARRHRAAVTVGLAHIPALIEDLLSDFDQVIENLHRAELSPMEMALFISGKQKGGMKPAEIARRLGLSRSAISKYFALVDAPSEIEATYASGRTTSPDTLYELRQVLDRWPERTRAWLASDVEVTRRSVEYLKRHLTEAEKDPMSGAADRDKAGHRTDHIRHPLLKVRIGERPGVLVLNRRSDLDNHILIRWDDGGEVQPVEVQAIQMVALEDGRSGPAKPRGRRRELRR